MELVLWRWSTTAQVASALLIAVFFAAAIRFSVGQAYLPPRGDGEAAMKAADEAMYRRKTAIQARQGRGR